MAERRIVLVGVGRPDGVAMAIAERLRDDGAALIVADVSPGRAEAAARSLGCAHQVCDITLEASIAALAARCAEDGPLDAVVNAVGWSPPRRIEAFDAAFIRQMADVNYVGPALLLAKLAPHIRAFGSYLQLSTRSAYDATPKTVAYSAAKLAMDRLLRGAAIEFSPRRLRANGLCISIVITPSGRADMIADGLDPELYEREFVALTPLGRLATPADVASLAAFMLSDGYFETGQVLNCTGGGALRGKPDIMFP